MLLLKLIESLDEIHSCLLRILMWNYQSKVNYLCVKLRVHFRIVQKKMQAVVLAVYSKQLYFFSGFNSGPVYHLRVVEQKLSFAQQNLCFVLNYVS